MIKNFFNFIAGFFQDQQSGADNAGSRKALTLYVLLFFLWSFVKNGAQGIQTDHAVFYGILFFALFTLGAIGAEFFSHYFGGKK